MAVGQAGAGVAGGRTRGLEGLGEDLSVLEPLPSQRLVVGAVSGGNLYRRSSFLLDAVGKRLFPEWVRIDEDPHLPGGARSSSFDSEGVATRQQPLIEAGVLQRYVLGSYSARKLGLPMERVVVTVQDHGNTSAASIPLALSVAVTDGRIKRGDLVLSEAIGGGRWRSAAVGVCAGAGRARVVSASEVVSL